MLLQLGHAIGLSHTECLGWSNTADSRRDPGLHSSRDSASRAHCNSNWGLPYDSVGWKTPIGATVLTVAEIPHFTVHVTLPVEPTLMLPVAPTGACHTTQSYGKPRLEQHC